MNLIYGIKDKPKFGQLIVFAIQQLLAIMAATLVVPVIVGNGMEPAAALFGAGVGTLVYLCFTKFNEKILTYSIWTICRLIHNGRALKSSPFFVSGSLPQYLTVNNPKMLFWE